MKRILFVCSQNRLRSPIAEQLGCQLESGPLGPFLKTDELRQTTGSQ